MKYMQFTAFVLLFLMTLKLMFLSRRTVAEMMALRSRWLMGGGIVILAVHFLMQFILGLRELGVTQAVMLNLAMFIPCSWLVSLSVLYLQRQGRLSMLERWMGGMAWLGAMTLLAGAIVVDGLPLLSDSPQRHWAEVIGSGFYMVSECFYAWRILTNLIPMHHALQDYYDDDMGEQLHWMQFSVLVLMAQALMVPMLIFVQSQWLAVFGVFCLFGLFYLVDSFSYYIVSSGPVTMQEAERNAEEEVREQKQMSHGEAQALSEEQTARVAAAVKQWVAGGGYLRAGVNCPTAADEMHIPRYQLTAWLRAQGLKYTYWLADLRIEEAKRMLIAHPDWSNETVSQHCGFNDRSYFHTTFKKRTGLTPAEFIESHRPT